MEQRAMAPVTLPPTTPTKSYWQDPTNALLSDYISADVLPAEIDTIIIGSGITGANIAYNLLQQPHHGSVLMLEARQVCSGATGRNGMPFPFYVTGSMAGTRY